jgi:hypothetical protein
MSNPQTQATSGTRHKTKTHKTKNTPKKAKAMSKMNPQKHQDYPSSLREITQQFLFLIGERHTTGIIKFGNSVVRDR